MRPALGRAVALVALATSGSAALAATTSAAPGGVTRIASPTANQVVGSGGGVQVAIRSRASLSRLQIMVDGHHVERYFRASQGAYRATLRVGSGLHLGIDELLVVTGASAEVDDVSFVVARTAPGLLGFGALQFGGGQAPVRVSTSVAPGATLQAWVNGHRDDAAFQPQAAGYVGLLGANDWLRSGENRVTLLAYRTSPSGRDAGYAVTTRTFWRKPGKLTAGAGANQITLAGQFIQLHGSASDPGSGRRGAPRVTYSWRIVGRPPGAVATLYHARSKTPGLVADAPGDYLISTRVLSANGSSSVDTVTVTVRADVPPIGAMLETAADDGTIKLNGAPVPDAGDVAECGGRCLPTTAQCERTPVGLLCGRDYSYAIWNRQTLKLVASGTTSSVLEVADLARTYDKAPSYLMVVNFTALDAGYDRPEDFAAGRQLLRTLGAPKMSEADTDYMLRYAFPKSIVGVPGSPAGSAFLAVDRGQPYHGRHAVDMSGYLRFNPLAAAGGAFEFVYADQAEFDTDASASPSQITMKVAGRTYAHDAPTDGSSGFFLVRLNSQTLALDQDFFYVTNRPDGTEVPGEAKRMADDIAWASSKDNEHGELLLMLQAFGKPKGTSAGWFQAAQAIEKLGGNAQVFAQLNQGNGDEPHQGRYAFVARSAMDVPAAVSSQSLTGHEGDGKLHGLLARGRDARYEPLVADPTGTVNFDLVNIVNRPSVPGGGFPQFTPGQAAAASFLGRQSDIIGVCPAAAPTCDVRKAYYEIDNPETWANILTRLGNRATEAACAESHPGFTPADCNAARQELELEIGRRNTVDAYFGQSGLQAPFVQAQVAALVDVRTIAEHIRAEVEAPPPSNATSNVLTILSYISRIGGFIGLGYRPALSISAGVAGAFALAGYETKDGTPELIGPKVNAAAVDLGSDLYTRYRSASLYFATEAKIIMSDWTKMSQVAAVANSDPRWRLEDLAKSVDETMRLATQQLIYQALIPVAYPVLYDLGTGVGNAKQWRCIGQLGTYNKNLFQHTEAGAQLTWTMTSSPSAGARHLFAVGGRHTQDSLHEAFIAAPPESITKPLFRDPTAPAGGGIGLYKLDLYSPQFFEVFPLVLQQKETDVYPYGFEFCQEPYLPDPPGNAGKG